MADVSGFQLTGTQPERYETYAAPINTPFVTALLDAVDLWPGATVLDLACGTGFTARAVAPLVGPTGRVHGADINEGMIRVAREHHPRLYPDIEFTVAPADRLPYSDGTFDAVVCQQGAQFFPDLRAALTETARVTRPGGRFAATVWAALDRQPYFRAQHRAVEEYGGPEAAENLSQAFSCTTEHLTAALGEAGYRDTAHREVTFGVLLPPLDEYARDQLSAVSWGALVAEAGGDDALARAGDLVRDQLTSCIAVDGTATVPFTATLVTATR
ncbi:methyltransferase domain-containing protein [Streptomyces sp. NPDC052109]|uniref:class I SAM-dependent methyltransferase n=1 Tax=Streptomyces sp. NPDC052109 TaxID=3155527 RepID=UPI00343F6A8A